MSWPLVAIGDVAEILSGNAWKSSQFTNESEGRLPIIRIQNISDVATDFIYWDGVALEKYIIKDGDLLLSLSGNVKLCEWSFGNALLNQRIVKLAPTACVDKRYFYWALHRVVAEIEAMARHAVIANVSVTDLKEFQIPLPPLPEQKRIAAILDKADAIRRKRKQAIQLADDFLRSVFLDMFGDPVTNPKGWEVCRFEDLTSLVTYGLTVRPQYHEDGVPLISAKEIRTGELDFVSCPRISKLDFDNLSEKGRPKKNDILFSKTGSIGHCAIVRTEIEFAVTQNAARIVPNTDVCEPIFLLAFLRTKYFYNLANKEAKGNAVKDLQLGIMKDFPVYLPPMLLQKKFVELYSKSESLIEKVCAGSVLLHSNFNGLSHKAFSSQF